MSLEAWESAIWLGYIAVAGLCVGSFLNVVIYRVPREESISVPGSHCPRCQTPIRWYDNVPVLAWLWLGRRCRECRMPIHWRYPAVELANGVLWVSLFLWLGPRPFTYVAMCLASAALALALIDFDTMLLPDAITMPGLLAGWFCSAAGWTEAGFAGSLIGAAAGFGLLYGVAVIGKLIAGREAMGFGDVKYMAMVGAFLGWEQVVLIFFGACVIGAVLMTSAMALRLLGRGEPFPFGPFLVLATIVALFAGPDLVVWFIPLFDPYMLLLE